LYWVNMNLGEDCFDLSDVRLVLPFSEWAD